MPKANMARLVIYSCCGFSTFMVRFLILFLSISLSQTIGTCTLPSIMIIEFYTSQDFGCSAYVL